MIVFNQSNIEEQISPADAINQAAAAKNFDEVLHIAKNRNVPPAALASAACLAIEQQQVETTKKLVELGAAPDDKQHNVLDSAITANNMPLAYWLLEHGASIGNDKRKGEVLAREINRNNNQTVRLLLKHGADPNDFKNKHLATAVLNNRAEIVKSLLEYKADPNDTQGQPLTIALNGGAVGDDFTEIADILMQHGADPVLAMEQVLTCDIDKKAVLQHFTKRYKAANLPSAQKLATAMNKIDPTITAVWLADQIQTSIQTKSNRQGP